jgi:hypothetical protein
MASQALTNRGLFHAYMFAAVVHSRACRGLPIYFDSQEILVSHAEAIHHLNRHLIDPNTACSDENILAIVYLLTSGLDGAAKKPASAPFQDPLKGLQCLDSYGIFETMQSHA